METIARRTLTVAAVAGVTDVTRAGVGANRVLAVSMLVTAVEFGTALVDI